MAQEHALVEDGTDRVLKIRTFQDGEKVPDFSAHPTKNFRWLPYVEETADDSTGRDKVETTGEYVVEAARIVRVTTIRDMTAAELKARDESLMDNALSAVDKRFAIERALAEAIFEIAKAAKTGNWTGFRLADGTAVTAKAHFIQYLREKL